MPDKGFFFKCPTTGFQVNTATYRAAVRQASQDEGNILAIECIACGKTHRLDLKTRKLVDDAEK